MKKIISIFLVLLMLTALSVTAYAESQSGQDGLRVDFTADGKLISSADFASALSGLQPGDDITVTITLHNYNKEDTDWYLRNDVVKSLEDGTAASGGAYTYTLSYSGRSTPLYDSDTVGGESISAAGEGLHEATSALKNYLFLDTIKSGGTGTVTLRVALDGESQLNAYNSTAAKLKMNFAVELRDSRNFVRTGDDTNLLPLFILMAVSGLLLLGFSVVALKENKKLSGEVRR